ncbi:hypothetical protein LTR99_010997 [Exophiala xenobiotica]|uniref:Cytochrome b561 domain-containing protein n=1 Tax=Vermiconidia calcicola TaxID=1690605 RepID=A0AAV9PTQ1_9PEZI|nr:hypothetical protein LTR99_010997 [Exophiala xenobiotica]KAK5399954.1 hypothetical protein LTR06_011392 [Exophiala xenobiotica]KAK5425610.1 hypothetical protein LTR34_010957 [Exophiala xenobiotica]KAK5527744.1 hypothetical protein LTR25_010945 [Vermiconidia calcicola]KAK5531212.1 hypothetical protein LTR23_010036 [Chaetothyriales sp. CCFEE 6169]
MSPSPQLAPPVSSSYDSDTMHVGDGTWDAGRDDFLLPNLVGFNFATMRYNGMGNRFFTMSGYHSLVEAHGIIAAVTFLGAVPLAIFLVRFYGRQPRMALRLHIWLQILTLLLSTVVIILGLMAVGPNRGLTNPHHGIGVAIYVLVWVQVIGGYLLDRVFLQSIRRTLLDAAPIIGFDPFAQVAHFTPKRLRQSYNPRLRTLAVTVITLANNFWRAGFSKRNLLRCAISLGLLLVSRALGQASFGKGGSTHAGSCHWISVPYSVNHLNKMEVTV